MGGAQILYGGYVPTSYSLQHTDRKCNHTYTTSTLYQVKQLHTQLGQHSCTLFTSDFAEQYTQLADQQLYTRHTQYTHIPTYCVSPSTLNQHITAAKHPKLYPTIWPSIISTTNITKLQIIPKRAPCVPSGYSLVTSIQHPHDLHSTITNTPHISKHIQNQNTQTLYTKQGGRFGLPQNLLDHKNVYLQKNVNNHRHIFNKLFYFNVQIPITCKSMNYTMIIMISITSYRYVFSSRNSFTVQISN